jgi:hypothetical protein
MRRVACRRWQLWVTLRLCNRLAGTAGSPQTADALAGGRRGGDGPTPDPGECPAVSLDAREQPAHFERIHSLAAVVLWGAEMSGCVRPRSPRCPRSPLCWNGAPQPTSPKRRYSEPSASAAGPKPICDRGASDAGDDPHARGAGIAGYLFPASKPSSLALDLFSMRNFFETCPERRLWPAI